MGENVILIALFFGVMIFGFFVAVHLGGFLEAYRKFIRKRRRAPSKGKQSNKKEPLIGETKEDADPKNE